MFEHRFNQVSILIFEQTQIQFAHVKVYLLRLW